MSDWNSIQYLKFKNERTQPAKDLAMRISNNPKTVVDIGCGPGNSTKVLRDFFPNADIIGIDNSPNMIKKAKAEYSNIDFRLCDALSLKGRYDLLFSNACLQWLPNHDMIIPFLIDKLNDGGILAVQVPMNNDEPLFHLIQEVAAEPRWSLSDIQLQPNETLTPLEYYNILSNCSSVFDMWEVKYYHTIPDHKALIDWVKAHVFAHILIFSKKIKLRHLKKRLLTAQKKYIPLWITEM